MKNIIQYTITVFSVVVACVSFLVAITFMKIAEDLSNAIDELEYKINICEGDR